MSRLLSWHAGSEHPADGPGAASPRSEASSVRPAGPCAISTQRVLSPTRDETIEDEIGNDTQDERDKEHRSPAPADRQPKDQKQQRSENEKYHGGNHDRKAGRLRECQQTRMLPWASGKSRPSISVIAAFTILAAYSGPDVCGEGRNNNWGRCA
jgi:hypothetical protein